MSNRRLYAYYITKALVHLKKSEKILKQLGYLNDKLDGDLRGVSDFCIKKIEELKKE